MNASPDNWHERNIHTACTGTHTVPQLQKHTCTQKQVGAYTRPSMLIQILTIKHNLLFAQPMQHSNKNCLFFISFSSSNMHTCINISIQVSSYTGTHEKDTMNHLQGITVYKGLISRKVGVTLYQLCENGYDKQKFVRRNAYWQWMLHACMQELAQFLCNKNYFNFNLYTLPIVGLFHFICKDALSSQIEKAFNPV